MGYQARPAPAGGGGDAITTDGVVDSGSPASRKSARMVNSSSLFTLLARRGPGT